MNKRIRELAEQAGIDFFNCSNPEHGDREYCEAWTDQQQKFAELIVQDCFGVFADLADLNREDMEAKRCIEDVKEHFGVKNENH